MPFWFQLFTTLSLKHRPDVRSGRNGQKRLWVGVGRPIRRPLKCMAPGDIRATASATQCAVDFAGGEPISAAASGPGSADPPVFTTPETPLVSYIQPTSNGRRCCSGCCDCIACNHSNEFYLRPPCARRRGRGKRARLHRRCTPACSAAAAIIDDAFRRVRDQWDVLCER